MMKKSDCFNHPLVAVLFFGLMLFACKANNGVESKDGKEDGWVAINLGSSAINAGVRSIVFDPSNGQIMYVAIVGGGVFKSTDGGKTWMAMNFGLGGRSMGDLAIDPRNPNVLYAATSDSGAFKTDNGGEDWAPVTSGLGFNIPAVGISPDGSTVYVGIDGIGAYRSADGGFLWFPSIIGDDIRGFAFTEADPKAVFIATPHFLWGSDDYGSPNSWSQLPRRDISGEGISFSVLADHAFPRVLWVSTWRDGIWVTVDGGENWTFSSKGLPEDTYAWTGQALAFFTSQTIFVGINGPGGVYRSDDGGRTWKVFGLAGKSVHLNALAVSADRIFVGTDGGFYWKKI